MTTQYEIPRAEQLMSRHVQSVSPDLTLADVIDFLSKHEISNSPVVEPDANQRPVLVGFISERDCLEQLSNEVFFGNPTPPQTARTIMKLHPLCVEPQTDAFTLASIFVNHGFRHLPVVEDEHLVGIVSRRDVLKALDHYYRKVIKEHDLEHFPPNLHEIIHHRFLTGRSK